MRDGNDKKKRNIKQKSDVNNDNEKQNEFLSYYNEFIRYIHDNKHVSGDQNGSSNETIYVKSGKHDNALNDDKNTDKNNALNDSKNNKKDFYNKKISKDNNKLKKHELNDDNKNIVNIKSKENIKMKDKKNDHNKSINKNNNKISKTNNKIDIKSIINKYSNGINEKKIVKEIPKKYKIPFEEVKGELEKVLTPEKIMNLKYKDQNFYWIVEEIKRKRKR